MSILLAVILVGWPKTMAVSVSGFDIRPYPSNRCFYDKKSGFFLYTTNDCDGGHRSIRLTKDRRLVSVLFNTTRFGKNSESAYPGTEIKDRPLPLITEDGITIGMTRRKVQSKLGNPSKTVVRGKKGEFWCAMYKEVDVKNREEGQVLRNTYIFKNSKLIEISINLDNVPGCGDDSLSDEGWPWTKF